MPNWGGVKVPETKLSCVEGVLWAGNNPVAKTDALRVLENIGEAFIKPSVGSSSGIGCAVIEMRNGKDEYSGKSAAEIIDSYGNNYIVQERVRCHSSIAQIYDQSVNAFRVITYRWRDDIFHMPVIMRIGRGNANVDNAHAGGIFIGLDDDGTMHKTAFTEFNNQFNQHPDTGTVFSGHKILGFEKIVHTAHWLHAMFPQIGVYNWDFTLDEEDDPILIEANTLFGSVWLCQMAHGTGPFGEKTPEILRWMREMKKMKYHDRLKHMHGNL